MKTWRLLNVELGLDEPESVLRERACARVGLDPEELRGFRIVSKSLDARRRRGVFRFVCHVDLIAADTEGLRRAAKAGTVKEAPPEATIEVERVDDSIRGGHAVVVGAGPAGLYAAWVLARNGVRVTLVDRGARLEERGRKVVGFHRSRVPDPETNLLFGEGGAGTYSDGKLYTRVSDPLEVALLELLIDCGAPAAIVYDSRAHIGTDKLHRLLPRLRSRLEEAGVAFHWETRLDGLVADGSRVTAVATSAGEIGCDALVLAPGHSARDTWTMLHEQGVAFEAKPFQFGVRIEHPQSLVTKGRFGYGPEADLLGAASYNLVCKAGDNLPGAHSFCMCPGGKIVASVNEPEHLCTNGMSNSTHSSRWANAALVTTFGPDEFGPGPFAGVAFQRDYERAFFLAGGGDYTAPAQRAPDFMAGRASEGDLDSSYTFGTRPGRIDELLPPRGRDALRRALEKFDRMVEGFAGPDGVLVGVESRSSGPVRMPRDRETFRARGFANLYPVGEGAGFAGGIMSAALDGARCAQALLTTGIR
jgi:uncharacterized FAD-dependent dehydrogenase